MRLCHFAIFCAVGSEVVKAASHTIFTANRNEPPQLHTLTFDDTTLSLKLVKSIKADSTHTWLSLSVSGESFLAGVCRPD